MPNIDAGHYFLTVLLPIKTTPVPVYKDVVTTPMLALRETIAGLPTAQQSPASLPGCNSPFARNTRNHFARLAVIDVPAFNGRVQGDTVIGKLRRISPIVPEDYDRLSTPYLFFSADFNSPHGDERDLDSYLETLWGTMEPELRAILNYCAGFESVHSAADFTTFIKRCQIETTMPFHDYWIDDPKLPSLSLAVLLGVGGIALLATIIGLFGFLCSLIFDRGPWTWAWLWPLVLGVGVLFGLYRFIMARGAQAYPAQADADLPGVLKSLYLQTHFTRFAIDHQGDDPASLQAAFGAFLQAHRPNAVATPTQAPGVIGA